MSQRKLRRRQCTRIREACAIAWEESGHNEALAIDLASERVGVFVEALLIRLAIELVVYIIKKRYFSEKDEVQFVHLDYIDSSNNDFEQWDDT